MRLVTDWAVHLNIFFQWKQQCRKGGGEGGKQKMAKQPFSLEELTSVVWRSFVILDLQVSPGAWQNYPEGSSTDFGTVVWNGLQVPDLFP